MAATAQRLGELTPGSAPLAAVLLQVCDGDEGEAAALLCTVLEVAEERVGEGRALLRTDCLLVADLVAAEMKDVADHFNRVGFDAVDLADIVCIWVGSVFAAQFPSEFVLRALDVMFTEENMVFAVIVFAIIAVHKEELLRAQEADKLYNYFYAIPELLQTQKIEKVFRVAYETLIGFPDLEQKRDQKDWEWTIRRPGVPGFTPGVGNYSEEEGDGEKVDDKLGSLKSAANSFILSPDTVPEEGDDLEEEEDMEGGPDIGDDIPEIEDKDFENPKELREKMKKVMDGVNFLRRKDDRARKVIRDLQQKIRLMEDDLSRLNHSPRSSTGGSFGAAGADLGNLVANLRKVEDTGIQGLGMPAPKTAEDDYKYQSFKLDDLNISYSSIYDQIEFPCPYMEGYLFKLSKAGIFSKPNLQRKWFVMKGRFLTYFKNHEHTRPQKDRCIDLKGCQIATLKRHPKGEFGIEISNSLYKFLIFAPDQTEFLKWVVALKAAASS